MPLAELIRSNREIINRTLYVGYANWDSILDNIERAENQPPFDFLDEQSWTFITAAMYSICGSEGATRLAYLLTGETTKLDKIWFEVLPISPRQGEGDTHLDLALGGIALREGTQSGIRYDSTSAEYICFCECKWYHDISLSVSNDRRRNQLARVLENALAFQGEEGRTFPKNVHGALITPAVFMNPRIKSRLYQYKYEEYATYPEILLEEYATQVRREDNTFRYPRDIRSRLSSLTLHWISFQELWQSAPPSILSGEVMAFANSYDRS